VKSEITGHVFRVGNGGHLNSSPVQAIDMHLPVIIHPKVVYMNTPCPTDNDLDTSVRPVLLLESMRAACSDHLLLFAEPGITGNKLRV
jgi:hypothetical protein